jgi:DNA polymerase
LAWTLDRETVHLWKPGDPDPQPLLDHIAGGGSMTGWNVIFEWHAWNLLTPAHWPRLDISQCRDTMAQAAVANLPQSLGECAKALDMPIEAQKDRRGKYLIQRLCKPHKPTKTRPGIWVEDPTLLEELYAYCVQDVRVEVALAAAMPEYRDSHHTRWLMTQRINLRGLPVDVDEIRAITRVVEQEKVNLNATLKAITGIPSANKREDLLNWVRARGVDIPDLTGDTVDQALASLPDSPARQALVIRSQVCQTSTAKFDKMLESCRTGNEWINPSFVV